MSQRLVHPHTGVALEPLWTDKFGRVHWPILGASEDDGEEDKDRDGDSGADSDKDSDGGSGSSEDKDKSKATGDEDLRKEAESLRERMKAADRRADAAEKRAREYEDKDKDKVEILERDLSEVTSERDTLKTEVADLRFANAFALHGKYTWQDPEIVLGILRKREEATLEDDGTIKGLDKALDAIAKEKPYLLKGNGDDEDDDKSDKDGPPRSGSATGSTKNKQGKPDEQKIRKKYRI
jgi:hypothetical protein